jgi:hypothetical protein
MAGIFGMVWLVISVLSSEGEIDKFAAVMAMPFLLFGVTAFACASVLPLMLIPIGLAVLAVGASRHDFQFAFGGLAMCLAGVFSVWLVFGS